MSNSNTSSPSVTVRKWPTRAEVEKHLEGLPAFILRAVHIEVDRPSGQWVLVMTGMNRRQMLLYTDDQWRQRPTIRRPYVPGGKRG